MKTRMAWALAALLAGCAAETTAPAGMDSGADSAPGDTGGRSGLPDADAGEQGPDATGDVSGEDADLLADTAHDAAHDATSDADAALPDPDADAGIADASDDTEAPDAVAIDASDTGAPDGEGPDDSDGGDADASGDADAGSGCAFPEPLVGGTPETAALAAAPARCGQPAYSWLDGPELGTVVARTGKLTVPAVVLNDLLTAEGIVPPAPIEHDIQVDQIRYVTQDRGVLIEATAAVAYPTDLPPGEPPKDIVLFLHGTSGFTDACSPSNDLAGQAFGALMASWGYISISPDYIGMKGSGEPTGFLHPYLVGDATAIASLDAVRALARLEPSERGDTCVAPRVLVFGGSQGGHAALWVDRLAPYYARELTLAGVIATVPPADVLGQAQRALQQLVPATANTIAMLATQASWYGVQDKLPTAFAEPFDTLVPEVLGASCSPGDGLPKITALDQVFQAPLLEAAAAGELGAFEPWGCLFTENGLVTTSIPRITPPDESYGILFVLGESDTLVDPGVERASVEALCDDGLPIEYLECQGASHTGATLYSLPEILTFMQARLAGEPFVAPCAVAEATLCTNTPSK